MGHTDATSLPTKGGLAMATKTARWAPVTGILAPLLWFFGGALGEKGAPGDGAEADEILTYFQEETTSILFGSVLFLFGGLLFILFLLQLRTRWGSGGSPAALSLMWATGLVGIAFLSATLAPQLGIAIAIEDMGASIQASTAETVWHAGTGFFVLGELLLALFFFSTVALNRAVAVLPPWLAWFALLIGVVALVPPIGWAAIIFGLPLWTLLAAIFLLLGARTPGAPESATPAQP